MQLSVLIKGQLYQMAIDQAVDIGIYQRYDGSGPTLFGGQGPSREAYTSGAFIGSMARGGPCNVDTIRITPHLDGTHTETAAHIHDGAPLIGDAGVPPLVAASLVTTQTTAARDTSDTIPDTGLPDDRVITHSDLSVVLESAPPGFCDAIIIRTLPNDVGKPSRDYDKVVPPYLSIEAAALLVDHGARHVVLDLPSIDRTDDGGLLACHHTFFGVGGDSTTNDVRTITELVYVPDSVPDGGYLLSLQYTRMATDAAPSRPVLIPLTPVGAVTGT